MQIVYFLYQILKEFQKSKGSDSHISHDQQDYSYDLANDIAPFHNNQMPSGNYLSNTKQPYIAGGSSFTYDEIEHLSLEENQLQNYVDNERQQQKLTQLDQHKQQLVKDKILRHVVDNKVN